MFFTKHTTNLNTEKSRDHVSGHYFHVARVLTFKWKVTFRKVSFSSA